MDQINKDTKYLSRKFSRKWSVAFVFTSCFFLPLLTRLILRLPELAFANFTDSVFYLSYSQSFEEIFSRHGFIYYASRFGAIFPDAVALNLFGPAEGPIILRLILACAVSGALFLVGRICFSAVVGVFASILWSFQPVAARLWCTTYLDSSSVPFLILGVCLLLLCRTSVAAAFFSGILVAFSITSHLYLVILAGCFVPLVLGVRWGDRRVLLCKQVPWFLGGLLLTIATAYYWYSINCGIGAFWQPTLELMRNMSDGQTELWKKPLAGAISETPLWISTLPFFVWATVFWKKLDAFGRGAFFALILSTVFFWAGDLVGGAYALSMPFYFSFLLPSLLLALVAFAGNSARLCESSLLKGLFFLCAVGAVVLPMVLKAQTKLPIWLTLLVCGAAVLGCALYFFRRQVFQSVFLLCLLLLSFLSLASGFYSQFLAEARIWYPNDRKIPALAVKLEQMLPPASEGDVIRFWYPESSDTELKMLQAFFLHTFSMLPGEAGFAKYPEMSAQDAVAIRRAGIQQVVLLDRDPARLDSAIQAMGQAGLNATQLQAQELRLGKGKIFYRRLLLQYPEMSNPVPIPLKSLEFSPEASLALNYGKCFLTTSNKRWNFDAWSTLGHFQAGANEVSLNAKVHQGRIELCLISESGKLISAIEIWPTEKPVLRQLYAGEGVKAHTLMIRNKMPDSSKSLVEISKIALGGMRSVD